MSPWALNRFVAEVSRGAVFGYPTDTIWGLGCDPLNAASVARILRIKNRKADKGLILLSSRLEYCLPFIRASENELDQLRQDHGHPITWLVQASAYCPIWIRGNHPTVAIRITGHPLVSAICEPLQSPLVSTSANRSGCSVARNRFQMQKQFATRLDAIICGFSTGGGSASEIKSLASGVTMRESTSAK